MVRTGFATAVASANTFPKDWVRLYTEKGFLLHDPTIHWAYFNTGACRWSELSDSDPRNILGLAAEHGLHYGVVACFRSNPVTGKRTIGNFTRPDREFSETEIKQLKNYLRRLHETSAPKTTLSKGEIEALVLLKRGFLIKEAAGRLCISESAVKQRLSGAKTKLDARTMSQAIGLATEYNLI